MPSPFPGMDPYLENPDLWSGFHASFIVELQTLLSPLLRPDYMVRVKERVYLSEEGDPAYRLIVPDAKVVASRLSPKQHRPAQGGLMIAEPIPVVQALDDEVHEPRLEIRDRLDRSVVAVIELLSPTNKVTGSKGRASFLQKRREMLESAAHWMEIDLLRGGVRTSNHSPEAGTPYQVYLSRNGSSRKGFIWPMSLREPLSVVGVPLRGDHDDVPLDLQTALDTVYARGAYDLDLEYDGDPTPPVSSADRLWIREQIQHWKQQAS